MPWLIAFLSVCLFAIPCYGNFFPQHVSFLLAMRYYAGNWAYNVWLFRKGASLDKLDRLKKSAGTMEEQLAQMGLDEETVPVVLNLVDQIHGLRRELKCLTTAIDEQPNEVRTTLRARVEHLAIRWRVRK